MSGVASRELVERASINLPVISLSRVPFSGGSGRRISPEFFKDRP